MNKLRMPFIAMLTLVVMVIAVSAYGDLELAESATEAEAVSAPDIEALRHQAYQAFKAGATSEPGVVTADEP
jgi:hypothetical protein